MAEIQEHLALLLSVEGKGGKENAEALAARLRDKFACAHLAIPAESQDEVRAEDEGSRV